jgi:hypothetical protein
MPANQVFVLFYFYIFLGAARLKARHAATGSPVGSYLRCYAARYALRAPCASLAQQTACFSRVEEGNFDGGFGGLRICINQNYACTF